MEFVIIYIYSVIISFLTEITNELIIFKNIADQGYKVNMKKLSSLSNDENKKVFLTLLMPIYNVFTAFNRFKEYHENREEVLKEFDSLGLIEKMTKVERKMYLEKPSYFNAFLVPLKFENRLRNAHEINIDNGYSVGHVYYEIRKDIKDITILKAEGNLENKTEEELKQDIYKAWGLVVESINQQIEISSLNSNISQDNLQKNDELKLVRKKRK